LCGDLCHPRNYALQTISHHIDESMPNRFRLGAKPVSGYSLGPFGPFRFLGLSVLKLSASLGDKLAITTALSELQLAFERLFIARPRPQPKGAESHFRPNWFT
jgi:hypothetical protein